MRADGERVAYRQRLCPACYASVLGPLEVATREFSQSCPACGCDNSEDMDPVYCTSYVPSLGRVKLELGTCAACAVRVRNLAMQGAKRLENRPLELRGQAPQLDSQDVWTQLGIQPR
jgi:hypothetical protein